MSTTVQEDELNSELPEKRRKKRRTKIEMKIVRAQQADLPPKPRRKYVRRVRRRSKAEMAIAKAHEATLPPKPVLVDEECTCPPLSQDDKKELCIENRVTWWSVDMPAHEARRIYKQSYDRAKESRNHILNKNCRKRLALE